MATVTLMPMIGKIRNERTHTLASCHALDDYAKTRAFAPGKLGDAVDILMKEVMLTPHMRDKIGRDEVLSFIMQVRP